VSAAAPAASRRGLSMTNRLRLTGFLFTLPALLFFGGFRLYPMLRAIQISFMEFDFLSPGTFVGLDNYAELLGDEQVHASFWATGQYLVLHAVPIWVGSFVVALLLAQSIRGRGLYLGMLYLPNVVPTVVAAIIWMLLYQPNGLFDRLVSAFVPEGINWLEDFTWAMPAVVFTAFWRTLGFYTIIVLAGLQAIPEEYYDAAKIDGAGALQRFRSITWPLMKPQTLLIVVISFIGSLQAFDAFFVMTDGGPGDATRVLAVLIYNKGFQYLVMGQAAALSILLFLLLLVLTVVQMRLFRPSFYDLS
jgi:multiple sugar transport system permease protein